MLIVQCFFTFPSLNLPATAKATLPVPPQLLAIAPQPGVEDQEPSVLGQGMTLSHEHCFYISSITHINICTVLTDKNHIFYVFYSIQVLSNEM